jgi:hypothetical protein
MSSKHHKTSQSHRHHQTEDHAQPDRSKQSSTVKIPRIGFAVLVVLLIAPWMFVVKSLVPMTSKSHLSNVVGEPNEAFTGDPGVWGTIKYTRIDIEPPSDFIEIDHANLGPAKWFFGGYTKDQLTDFFKSSGLTDTQQSAIILKDRWDVAPAGITVYPDDDVVMGMDPATRGKIYRVLDDFAQNEAQRVPYSFRPDLVDEQIANSNLKPETKTMLKSLLYPCGSSLLFSDLATLLPKISDRDEKLRLFKTITRRLTLLAKLKITPDSNVDQLVDYWGFHGRAKDLRPLFESLKRVPGGCAIDLAHLLPPMARKLVYTYPYPSTNKVEMRRDCHWTSLNFFSSTPDDHFTDPAVVKRTLETEYYPINSEPKLGDIVVLSDSNGIMIHSAAYLADNIVFTKNGAIFTQPWMYMKLDDMQVYYQTFYPPDKPVKMMILRHKGDGA